MVQLTTEQRVFVVTQFTPCNTKCNRSAKRIYNPIFRSESTCQKYDFKKRWKTSEHMNKP